MGNKTFDAKTLRAPRAVVAADVRRVGPTEWRVWREVRLRALADAPSAFGSTLANWSGPNDLEHRWRSRLSDVPANVVAHVDGQPVGQAGGARTPDPLQVELISMWVAPEARGLGIGDALIDVVVDWARDEADATSIVLWVRVDNRLAIHLYERKGFQRTALPENDNEFEMLRPLA